LLDEPFVAAPGGLAGADDAAAGACVSRSAVAFAPADQALEDGPPESSGDSACGAALGAFVGVPIAGGGFRPLPGGLDDLGLGADQGLRSLED
jgi:hypothetical protein